MKKATKKTKTVVHKRESCHMREYKCGVKEMGSKSESYRVDEVTCPHCLYELKMDKESRLGILRPSTLHEHNFGKGNN